MIVFTEFSFPYSKLAFPPPTLSQNLKTQNSCNTQAIGCFLVGVDLLYQSKCPTNMDRGDADVNILTWTHCCHLEVQYLVALNSRLETNYISLHGNNTDQAITKTVIQLA